MSEPLSDNFARSCRNAYKLKRSESVGMGDRCLSCIIRSRLPSPISVEIRELKEDPRCEDIRQNIRERERASLSAEIFRALLITKMRHSHVVSSTISLRFRVFYSSLFSVGTVQFVNLWLKILYYAEARRIVLACNPI